MSPNLSLPLKVGAQPHIYALVLPAAAIVIDDTHNSVMDTSHLVIQRVEQNSVFARAASVSMGESEGGHFFKNGQVLPGLVPTCMLPRPKFQQAAGFTRLFQEIYPYLVTPEQIMRWTDKPGPVPFCMASDVVSGRHRCVITAGNLSFWSLAVFCIVNSVNGIQS
ncbi:hypothetical protein N7490_012262 [Penicillium lividum]|nr:hypothetical protein N7490_012262 [Penicillium lividum]